VANRKFSVATRFANLTFYLAAVTVLRMLLSGMLCLGNLIAMYQCLEWTSTLFFQHTSVQGTLCIGYTAHFMLLTVYCQLQNITYVKVQTVDRVQHNVGMNSYCHELWGPHRDAAEDSGLLGYNALSIGKWLSVLWRIVILDPEDEGITCHQNIGNLPVNTAW
jgi:hypothetical protein